MAAPRSTLDIRVTSTNGREVRIAPKNNTHPANVTGRLNGSVLSEKSRAVRSGDMTWAQLDQYATSATTRLERLITRFSARELDDSRGAARARVVDALETLVEAFRSLEQAARHQDMAQLDAAELVGLESDIALARARKALLTTRP